MLYPLSGNICKYDHHLRVMLELVECCLLLQLPSQNIIRQILNVVSKYVITPSTSDTRTDFNPNLSELVFAINFIFEIK